MRIAIGSDHGGFPLKEHLITFLKEQGHLPTDYGTDSAESADYADFANEVCRNVIAQRHERGILICRTGVGMTIAANRFVGIRAASVRTPQEAATIREHNGVNVLCLGADLIDEATAKEIVKTFLTSEFAGGRHEQRLLKASGSRLALTDPELFSAMDNERLRQTRNIELIASENFTSGAVMEAQGSLLTNKYAEGYPHRRWYGGCECVDVVEQLAIDRAKEIFGAEHANVQPHSGSQANTAVYFSVLDPGDKILTMDLAHGGHLTHGHKANFSGKFYEVTHYGVGKEDERIDYDGLAKLAEKVRPKLITTGASAYPRIIDFEKMAQIAHAVGAYLFVDMAHIAGLVAGGVHPNPVPHADFITTTTHKSLRGPRGGLILCKKEHAKAIDSTVFPGIQGGPLMHVIAAKAACLGEILHSDFSAYARQVVSNAQTLAQSLASYGYRIVSGGTDNHLLLVDLRSADLNGSIAQETLDAVGITVNKNAIPFDSASPFKPSGIRLGTPAVTTRGMKEKDLEKVALFIHKALQQYQHPQALTSLKEEVYAFNASFSLPA